jgi:hypothetical protein
MEQLKDILVKHSRMENSSRMKAKGLDTVQTQYNGRTESRRQIRIRCISSLLQQRAALASPDRVKLLHAACKLQGSLDMHTILNSK